MVTFLYQKNYKKLSAELLDNINTKFKRVKGDKEFTKKLLEDKGYQQSIIIELIKTQFSKSEK